HQRWPDSERRVEGLPCRLVLDQLYGADQANATGLADQRMVLEAPQFTQENRRQGTYPIDDLALLIDLDGFQGDGGADRMAGIGDAMAEDAILGAVVAQGLIDLLIDQDGRDRQHAGRKLLCHGHDIWLHVQGLAAPEIAGPAETT